MPRQRINYRRTIHHFPNDFPRSLERFKDASGLTWGEMARRLGTNTLTLRRWRAGTRPNALHLLALLDLAEELKLAHLLPKGYLPPPIDSVESPSSPGSNSRGLLSRPSSSLEKLKPKPSPHPNLGSRLPRATPAVRPGFFHQTPKRGFKDEPDAPIDVKECCGIGPATLLIAAGSNHDRLHSEAAFASLCGVNPIPASSGKTNRHRLNRGGHRQANAALHRIVVVRLRHDERTQAYMRRRTTEGMSKAEVIRCLKRYVAREVFSVLRNSALSHSTP